MRRSLRVRQACHHHHPHQKFHVPGLGTYVEASTATSPKGKRTRGMYLQWITLYLLNDQQNCFKKKAKKLSIALKKSTPPPPPPPPTLNQCSSGHESKDHEHGHKHRTKDDNMMVWACS